MEEIIKLKEEIALLDIRIESQMQLVSKRLMKTDRIEELEDCAVELTRLLSRRRLKNDLLIHLTNGGGAQREKPACSGLDC